MFEKFTTDSRQIKFPDYVSTRLWALIWTELLSIQSGVIKDQKNPYLYDDFNHCTLQLLKLLYGLES